MPPRRQEVRSRVRHHRECRRCPERPRRIDASVLASRGYDKQGAGWLSPEVCRPAGKKFAQEFGITGNVGVVLSDRAGSTQAFWHQGDMTSKVLAGYLQKYAAPQARSSLKSSASPGMSALS